MKKIIGILGLVAIAVLLNISLVISSDITNVDLASIILVSSAQAEDPTENATGDDIAIDHYPNGAACAYCITTGWGYHCDGFALAEWNVNCY